MLVAQRPWGFDSLRPHLDPMEYANYALRFLLELAALAALVTSSRITTARVALDSGLSRFGWTRTVSAMVVTIPW